MFARLLNFLRSSRVSSSPSSRDVFPSADFAAFCLLCHAAEIEGGCDEREQAALRRLAVEGFHLEAAEVDSLLALAADAEREASDLFRWTRQVNEAYDHEQKCALLEKMWQVVLSDGVIGDFEANLLRRTSGLLYIPDREAGEARQRAARRIQT